MTGVELDIGTLPDADEIVQGETEDPERLANVTARVVARAGDRLGIVRKISRHFEGEDRRAGILSDVLSALWLLYRRNPEAVEAVIKQGAQLVRAKQEARKVQTSNGKTTNHNGGAA